MNSPIDFVVLFTKLLNQAMSSLEGQKHMILAFDRNHSDSIEYSMLIINIACFHMINETIRNIRATF